MNWIQILKRGRINVLKGIAVALASLVGLVIGGIITSALNMPAPVMPANVNLVTLLPLMFLSEIVIAIVLGERFQSLYSK
jgi:hypothetical protein